MSLTWLAATPRTGAGRPRADERAVVVVSAVADHHQGALVGPGPATETDPVAAQPAPDRGDPAPPHGAGSC